MKENLVRKEGVRIKALPTAIILLILMFGNIYIYFSNKNITLSGFAVSNIREKIITGIKTYDPSTIIFVVQWFILFIILLILYINFLKRKRQEKKEIKSVKKERQKKGTATDLDSLYELLKDKKRLGVSSIAKAFNISEDKAMEWAKIFEKNNLGYIEYPAFSEAKLCLKEENGKKK